MYLFAFLLSLLTSFALTETAPSSDPQVVYLSTDQGKSWASLSDGLPAGGTTRHILEHDNKLFIALDNAVYVLPEGAKSWSRSYSGLPSDEATVSLVARGDRMVVGTVRHGVYLSNDGGKHWRRPIFNIRSNYVRSLLFTDEGLLAGTESGLWRSYDTGESWYRAEGELAFDFVPELAEHHGRLFVAKQNTIGTFQDGKVTWSDLELDTPIIQLISEGDYLYMLTGGGETFRSTDGSSWETVKGYNRWNAASTLPEYIWRGYRPELPEDMSSGVVLSTSRGWVVAALRRRGC